MNIDPKYIQELGELILRCEDVVETESWDALAFVFDVGDGHMANSGFIYVGDKVIPSSAEVVAPAKTPFFRSALITFMSAQLTTV